MDKFKTTPWLKILQLKALLIFFSIFPVASQQWRLCGNTRH